MVKLPTQIYDSMVAMGFFAQGSAVQAEPLTGGVASEIWRVHLPSGDVCAKMALSQLKVAQEWRVPVDRNAYEVAWFRRARQVVPEAVPEILGHDPGAGVFVMEYLPQEQYQVWKTQLSGGQASTITAQQVARVLAAIHSSTALNEEVARQFATDELFFALRPEPYLLATAERHPELKPRLQELADRLMAHKKALVHGDVSPKNILVGERGPVIIDAECAWYGDPAFDLAFCLNHLLLKCLLNPAARTDFLRCFHELAAVYLRAVDWEPVPAIERRVAQLLPGLLLGRMDGKSPVEYVTREEDKQRVRRVATTLLRQPTDQLAEVAALWAEEWMEG